MLGMAKVNGEPKSKFMMSLHPQIIKELEPWMNGFNLQELIRAKIIPEWQQQQLGVLVKNAYGRGYQAGKRKGRRYLE